MTEIVQFDAVERAKLDGRPLHLAIGIFDGVHRGHKTVVASAVEAARRDGGQSAVLTFSPHPSVLLRPQQPTRLMMDQPSKARVLGSLGAETMITQPFTPAFAEIAAEAFLPWLKQRLPQLVAVYVGENWRFGKGRKGDVESLKNEGAKHGIAVSSSPRLGGDGEAISSSRIRELIAGGSLAAANSLLGHSYFSEGVVKAGKRLGRTLGFPTLNLDWSPDLRPAFGVYVVRVLGAKSANPLPAVANYGLRPTVEKTVVPRLEVHVLAECPYDAGDVITVEWLNFLRPETKFSGLGELRAQIARDREAALAYFSPKSGS